MEKEIKVRKKRFAAFWLVVALLFSQLVPVTINAAEYTVSGLSTDQVLSAGDVIQNSADACDVTYYDADGTTVLSGKTIAANEAHTVSGYSGTVPVGSRFSGWKVSSVYVSGGYSGSIDLIAQFTTLSYTITFDTAGGSEIASITQAYGTAVTTPGNPTRTGYTFAGWDKEIPTTMPAENLTIKAIWTANRYIVKFVNEDGTELQSSEVAYGETPAYTGETPTKAATAENSYTFAGWSPAIAAVTGDATYTATFTQSANQYMITFDTAGGSEIAPITGEYGTAITVPGNPTREGYTFTGWDQTIPATMPAENITITAQWAANTYYIRYELSGGTNGNNPPAYTYGEGVASLADAVKDGYAFIGWYSDAAFTTKVESIGRTQSGDITLYAQFEYVPAVIEAGTHELEAGVQYKLGNVTKVSGDTSVYASGSTFYVSESGTYTFS